MSLQISSSQVPQALFSLAAHCSWELGATVSSGVEAAFYSNLKGGITEAKKITTWTRTSSIAHIETIQTLFNMMNFGIALFYTAKLVDQVNHTNSGAFDNSLIDSWYLTALAVIITMGIGTRTGLELLNQSAPKLKEPETHEGIETKESLSLDQNMAIQLQTTKLILICALSVFEQNKLLKALSFATASYSLYKNRQLKWIHVSKVLDLSSYNMTLPIESVRATYNMLVLPFDQKEAHNTCPICLDDKQPVDMTLCAQHTIHRSCAAKLAVSRMSEFLRGGYVLKNNKEGTDRYTIMIPEANLLHCPTCHDPMLQNSCDLSITDRSQGLFTARATIIKAPVNRQPLFENLYALYCSA